MKGTDATKFDCKWLPVKVLGAAIKGLGNADNTNKQYVYANLQHGMFLMQLLIFLKSLIAFLQR